MRLKEAKGRGNQGDWVMPRGREFRTLPAHRDWNAEVEAKKLAKKKKKSIEDS